VYHTEEFEIICFIKKNRKSDRVSCSSCVRRMRDKGKSVKEATDHCYDISCTKRSLEETPAEIDEEQPETDDLTEQKYSKRFMAIYGGYVCCYYSISI